MLTLEINSISYFFVAHNFSLFLPLKPLVTKKKDIHHNPSSQNMKFSTLCNENIITSE